MSPSHQVIQNGIAQILTAIKKYEHIMTVYLLNFILYVKTYH